MKRFYHWTDEGNIENILQEGLRPGIELGMQEQYGGIDIDHRYIYLAKNLLLVPREVYREKKLLSVDIPEDHPIERDYDVAEFIEGTHGFFGLLSMLQIIANLGIKPINDKIDFSNRESMVHHLERVSDETWDNTFGFYRTHLPIPPDGRYKIERMTLIPNS